MKERKFNWGHCQNSSPQVFFCAMVASIYVAAWIIQDHLFINWDVSYLLHAARLLLAGGRYTDDFFMPNPPLILYLYLPPLIVSKYFHIKLILLVRGYVFFLATLSLMCSAMLIKKILINKDQSYFFLKQFLLIGLVSIFLLLPSYDFGQREHLLIIFTLPYLLLMVCRQQDRAVVTHFAFFVGLLAGFGFAIKPQFCLVPLLMELVFYQQKNKFAWRRPELLAMASVMVFYALVLLLFYPDFMRVIVPYVLRNYYPSIGEPWANLLFNNVVLFCCLPLVMHVLLYKKNPHKMFAKVLALALLGSLLIYLAQRTTFYYHLLPAFSLAILLLALLFSVLAQRAQFSWFDYLAATIVGMLGAAFLFYQVKIIWLALIFSTAGYFCFFAVLFTFLLAAAPQRTNLLTIVSSVFFILLTGFIGYYLAQRTSWSSYQVLITTFILLALFGLVAPRTRGGAGANILIASLGLILFAYPAFFSYDRYWIGVSYKEKILNKLVAFMRTQAPRQSIYVFSIKGSYGSPLMDYANGRLAQRFDCLWPVAGFVRRVDISRQYLQDKSLFINMIAEDLHRQKPDLVFIDKRDAKMLVWDKRFNYLVFFSQSQRFKEEWKAYRYLTVLRERPEYELEVYRRVK